MKFLVDAQLPRRMVTWLRMAGYDAIHTMDLDAGNRTADVQVISVADRDGRVVVTKDADFVDSHTLKRQPEKLLLVSTGNLTNAELKEIFVPLISRLAIEFEACDFLEIGRSGLIVRS
jgi:predicted nuclease of predicted toxin-antitoxin system